VQRIGSGFAESMMARASTLTPRPDTRLQPHRSPPRSALHAVSFPRRQIAHTTSRRPHIVRHRCAVQIPPILPRMQQLLRSCTHRFGMLHPNPSRTHSLIGPVRRQARAHQIRNRVPFAVFRCPPPPPPTTPQQAGSAPQSQGLPGGRAQIRRERQAAPLSMVHCRQRTAVTEQQCGAWLRLRWLTPC